MTHVTNPLQPDFFLLVYNYVLFTLVCVCVFMRVWERARQRDKEREGLCKEFGKLNKVPQESLPKDLGECSRFQGERPLKSENTLALSY